MHNTGPEPLRYIAIIDDEESFRRSLARLLHARHYHPVAYASAEDFLADTAHPRFGCILLDIALQGMSGLELARRLAAVGSRTPVVFVSAQNDAKTRARAEEAGAPLIGKLEPKEALLDAIAASLGHGIPPGSSFPKGQ